ncbi:SEA (Seh1-associated) complex subunit [Saxophila tyrrhenica]|uniref:SEA (Seh1-associated) complex subunit n=1 Tax=Saxophila tyrrhenica TaxID=1690608 RepID=A0AAV9P351_9PEZI|nr:SEA (Seh1-associated) complex subunit [Saxophila tyrrhenica]
MSHSRRSSTIPFASGDAPSAPPLPAPRPLQRARDAATRLFGYSSRAPSPEEDDRIPYGGGPRFAALSATQNASASHRTGLEINTIAINESGTHALLGGKEIFKTVKVEDGTCAEEVNLRSAIRSTPTQASGKARQIYSINIADVAWAKGDSGDYVAAATSSGKIILYDLGHAGLQAAQLHEHARQASIRMCAQVRDVRLANTLKSKHKYSGQADGIRDVKWSPTEGVDFAFGTDSGWIQRWDLRNMKTAKVKIPAHGVTCNAIDWHPDGKHIASASADKTVRVWDFSTARRQKASWEVRTPHPVLNARWRPSCESSQAYDNGARHCTQLVTAYDPSHPVLHVWDLRRPALPFRELTTYPSAPSDLLWHSQDLLWTVGREGVFLQTDIQYATKTITKRNLQAISVSPQGEVNIATTRRWCRRSFETDQTQPAPQRRRIDLNQTPDHSGLSRSWADDSVDHSFLSISPEKLSREPSVKSRTQSLSMTTMNDEAHAQLSTAYLSDVLSGRRSFRPSQAACRGLLQIRKDPQAFKYLAQHLSLDLRPALLEKDFLAAFRTLVESNAKCLEALDLFRLAQSWQIVSFIMTDHLQERHRSKQQQLLGGEKTGKKITHRSVFRDIASKSVAGPMRSPASSPADIKPVSSIAQQLAISESASEQRTPQAQPRQDGVSVTVPEEKNQLTLPTFALLQRPWPRSPSTQQVEENEVPLTRRNLDGLQEQQLSNSVNRRDMVHRWNTQPKEPLSLESADKNGVWIQPKLQKHDSNESFAFLAESSDSRDPSFPSSFNSNESISGPLRMVAERPAERPSRTRLKNDASMDGVEAFNFFAKPDAAIARTATLGRTKSRTANNTIALTNGDAGNDASHGPSGAPQTSYFQHIGPGSYPDENGISPLAEVQPPSPQLQVPDIQAIEEKFSARHEKTGGVRDNGIVRCSSEKPEAHDITHELESVFLPEDGDADVELGKPFLLRDVVQEMASGYARKGNAQSAAALYLLLGPLLPRTHPLPANETEVTASACIESLKLVGFDQDGVEQVLLGYVDAIVSSGLQPLQVEAVLEAYHDQLLSQQLFDEAAELRKLSYPVHVGVYDQALKDNYIHLKCGSCGKPLVNGMSKLLCETCNTKQLPCPVCWCDRSPLAREGPALAGIAHVFTTCLLCNHSGHATCLQVWFQESGEGDGGCPIPGCLCDCVAGSWRAQKTALAEKKRRSRDHGRVKSDEWPAQANRAVEKTRSVLAPRSVKSSRSGSGT